MRHRRRALLPAVHGRGRAGGVPHEPRRRRRRALGGRARAGRAAAAAAGRWRPLGADLAASADARAEIRGRHRPDRLRALLHCKRHRPGRMPIVALSANMFDEKAAECAAAGMDGAWQQRCVLAMRRRLLLSSDCRRVAPTRRLSAQAAAAGGAARVARGAAGWRHEARAAAAGGQMTRGRRTQMGADATRLSLVHGAFTRGGPTAQAVRPPTAAHLRAWCATASRARGLGSHGSHGSCSRSCRRPLRTQPMSAAANAAAAASTTEAPRADAAPEEGAVLHALVLHVVKP